ncbi:MULTISPECIES: tautomerase family protein [Microbacterium]|jgi:hypothetical protein|uniref:tautomerase family protein n=1 Tax=Microbacterium TaxID=33882 RepID=UPI0006FDEE8C|nr:MULTISPECIES: tautomerase family protein [Microbacterium]KQM37157.1 hypothetical protein ASE56_12365 [Microbacterium sp. Leaf203]
MSSSSRPRPYRRGVPCPTNRRTLYRALARNLKDRLDIGGEDLVVSITENGDADWSFGHGTAQFLTGELG